MTEVSEKKSCSQHGEYAPMMVMVGHRKIDRGCPECLKQYQNAEADRKARSEALLKAERVNQFHAESMIPKRFKECRFDNFYANNEGQERALNIAKNYAESWNDVSNRGAGLILLGKAGTGKTHLACAIANEVIDCGIPAKFTTVTNMMREIKSTYDKDSSDSETQILRRLSSIPLLVLDEAGMDYGTDFNKTLLFEVLNSRYENVNPTIILTNLDAAAIREYLGERVIDRMRDGGGKMVTFNWESHRK